jgi:hypothetical protein
VETTSDALRFVEDFMMMLLWLFLLLLEDDAATKPERVRKGILVAVVLENDRNAEADRMENI